MNVPFDCGVCCIHHPFQGLTTHIMQVSLIDLDDLFTPHTVSSFQ